MTELNFVWYNTDQETVDRIKPRVVADMIRYMTQEVIDNPEMLITHTVFLSDNMTDGPVVHVWGEEDDNRFHCEYQDSVKWVSLDASDIDEQD
jgi:hypothetical protein